METRVGGRYRLEDLIKKGKSSEIYKSVDVITNKYYAVKILKNKKNSSESNREVKIYSLLHKSPGFAKVHWHGSESKDSVIVLDLLGPSLEDLVARYQKLSLQTVSQLAVHMIEKIRILHSKHIIHRDIKPDDFLIEKEGSESIYLIDFNLAKSFKDSKNKHIAYTEEKNFVGTARYASVNTHLGIEQSRRDDFECLAYSLVYMANGRLPWQGVRAYTNTEKFVRLTEKKLATISEVLCDGLPSEFRTCLEYARSLKFEERPQYDYLKGLFAELARKINAENQMYEWVDHRTEEERQMEGGEGEIIVREL